MKFRLGALYNMACINCGVPGYEGQLYDDLGGMVCFTCLDQWDKDEKENHKKDLSDNVGHDIL